MQPWALTPALRFAPPSGAGSSDQQAAQIWGPPSPTAESVGRCAPCFLVGGEMLRTIFFALLLGCAMALVAYFSIEAAAGEGEGLFRLTAAVAASLACGAATCRSWRWLRLLLAVASFSVLALL